MNDPVQFTKFEIFLVQQGIIDLFKNLNEMPDYRKPSDFLLIKDTCKIIMQKIQKSQGLPSILPVEEVVTGYWEDEEITRSNDE